MPQVLDLETLINPDNLASEIGNQWMEWDTFRSNWKTQTRELRNYLYATDTQTTGNALLPWSNTTTTPKLTQIADNLHANYFATLFPRSKWLTFKGDDSESANREKARLVESWVQDKVDKSGFVNTCSELLVDWIHTGNCFAMVDHKADVSVKDTGDSTVNYVGPVLRRVSPYDIVFDPTATSFEESPKILRTFLTLGDIKRMSENDEEMRAIFEKMLMVRREVNTGDNQVDKSEGFVADGFSNISEYYTSNYVEVLTFYGDLYDAAKGELLVDHKITVVDRAYVLDASENPSWSGRAPIFHAGWRTRPDNLYAMGPLDNLVGMQYRIDHLENLKADVFDQFAYPIQVIRGDVEDYDYAPSTRIYAGEEGAVDFLRPDPMALQADLQINLLEQKMEEFAGAPKQAMGIRTPGEKTAFEVQTLQNSASRIFEHKTAHFERTFLEPILNAMLEIGRRKMQTTQKILVDEGDPSQTFFTSVSKEDITGNGRVTAMGARHFAERARRVQNINQLLMVKGDPSVQPHLSGKMIAKILAEEIGEPELFGENISIEEQMETQTVMQNAEADNQEQLAIAAEEGL